MSFQPSRRTFALAAAASPALLALGRGSSSSRQPRLSWPCADYQRGLRGTGNFGAYIDKPGSAFHGSWHLAEDVWLPAGTEVRAIADGIVRYSAFSPTWTDERRVVHWNLGNVIVLEHDFDPELDGHARLCSFHVHLGADRRVELGERVERGALLGRIGADRSEENGRYPAHLHFGIHVGAYVQIYPQLERELRAAAKSERGLVLGPNVLRGELTLERRGASDVFLQAADGSGSALLSLLVGSTAPEHAAPDIMGWCQGYGPKEVLGEWLAPAKFLCAHAAT